MPIHKYIINRVLMYVLFLPSKTKKIKSHAEKFYVTLWYQILGEPVHVMVQGFFPLVHLCVGWESLSSFLSDVAGLWTTLCIIVSLYYNYFICIYFGNCTALK